MELAGNKAALLCPHPNTAKTMLAVWNSCLIKTVLSAEGG
jgi:hypothetical protein